jgi:hypothetical protein
LNEWSLKVSLSLFVINLVTNLYESHFDAQMFKTVCGIFVLNLCGAVNIRQNILGGEWEFVLDNTL